MQKSACWQPRDIDVYKRQPFIVREMTDHEAVQAMKDSNKQRDGMLPSELAALLELEVEDVYKRQAVTSATAILKSP